MASSTNIIAFLDLGTHAARLLVARFDAEGGPEVVARAREVTRLGDGLIDGGELRLQAIERTIEALRRLVEHAQSHGAEEFHAVATAAARQASNRDVLLDRLRREIGLGVRVIDGEDESRLIYLGAATVAPAEASRILALDIGGGSTELVLGGRGDVIEAGSAPLGAATLAAQFPPHDSEAPIPTAVYDRMRLAARAALDRALSPLRRQRVDVAVGTGGTARDLVAAAAHRRTAQHETSAPPSQAAHADLRAVLDHLRSLPPMQRAAVPGLDPSRADAIVAGGAILDVIMEELRLPSIRATDLGLCDGLAISFR